MGSSRFRQFVAGALLAEAAFAVWPMTTLAQSAPPNDDFGHAIVINGSSEVTNVVYGSNTDASWQYGEPNHGGYSSKSVWWSWTATSTRSISISTEGSSFDTLLGVYTGTAVTNLAAVCVNDDSGSLQTSQVLFRAIAGETYRIAVDGFQSDTGNIQLTIAPAGINTGIFWDTVDIQGHPVHSRDFLDKVVLIDFWSVTCPPCLDELPHFVSLQNQLPQSHFQVVALFTTTPLEFVQSLVSSLGINFPMAQLTPAIETPLANLQPNPTPTIQAFPTTYVYDRENRLVVQILDGAKDYSYFQNLILPLLRSSNSIQVKADWQPGGLRLSWGGADRGDILESATDLSSPNWSPVLNIYGQTEMTVPQDEGARFYRIRRP